MAMQRTLDGRPAWVLDRGLVLPRVVAMPCSIIAAVALTALGAQVKVSLPGTPVPATLQVFFVLCAGLFMGQTASLAMAIYVLLGIAGIPVFADGQAGTGYLLGHTGGYILGFMVAPLVMALVYGGRPGGECGVARLSLGLLAGLLAIYVPGVLWLSRSPLVGGLDRAIVIGALWFIPFDIVKMFGAAVVARRRSVGGFRSGR